MPDLLQGFSYVPRLVDDKIVEALSDFGAVCIQGPKYCGKTWAGLRQAQSEMNLMDPAGNFQNLEIARLSPELALEGAHPRLLDEWQEAPALWDAVRNRVDRSDKKDTYILTGSATPRESRPHHSGIGRIEKVRMRPMSLAESGESSAEVSLKGLFKGDLVACKAPAADLKGLAELVVRGGWPGSLRVPATRARRLPQSYMVDLQNSDLAQVDGVRRETEKVARLLHSLARNAEQATATKTMIRDMTENAEGSTLSIETVKDYLDALKGLFVLEEIAPWTPNLRSPLRINKRPKYHFVDPSLPAAVLKATADMLMGDVRTFGFLFESLCVRDVLIYAEAMDAEVFYYRDKNGLEADIIVQDSKGAWAALEVKLGHNQADVAAQNLLKLKQKIVTAGGDEPVFLGVVEGLGEFAITREDGVHIIPVRTLGA